MLGWLQTTAEWAGPIAAILNFVIAAVGLPIAIWKGLKARRVIVAWFGTVLGSSQNASHESTRAADNAQAAALSANGAQRNALDAHEKSQQVMDVLEWALPEIMKRDAIIDQLKDRVDGLLGTRARQAAVERTGQFLLPPSAADDADPATETGRHRLHTSLIDTGAVAAEQYDPFREQEP